MATKNPRARKPKEQKDNSGLLAALEFISVAQHTTGSPMQTHCRMSNGRLTAFNGGIAAGVAIEETLNVCPHTHTLITALSKCGDAISITELDTGRISVKSGKFNAKVPCAPFYDLQDVEPDPPIADLTEAVREALRVCLILSTDGGDPPYTACVLLQADSVVSTNRAVLLEAWHGVDLPPNILLPHSSAKYICEVKKPIAKFGFSANSATFYYDDGSFIKTQLFNDNYPDYKRLLNVESNPWNLPEGFYEALDKVFGFNESKQVFFRDGEMRSHLDIEVGASCAVEGLPNGLAFNAEYLRKIKPYFQKVHFNANGKDLTLFFGDGVRGGIMGVANASA